MEYKEEVLTKYLKTHSNEDREAVIIEYAKLAKLIAGQMFAKNSMHMLEKGDYEGFAILGLIDAIQKYNESVGVKFETYATHRIRGAIIDELRKFDTVKRATRENQKLYKELCQKALITYGPNYTRDQLLKVINMTEDELFRIEQDVIIEEAVSFEGLLGINEDDPKFDPKDESGLGDGEKQIMTNDLKESLKKALSVLTENEQQVITLIYYEELTQAEVAKIKGISESRVSQIHSKALIKMRNAKELEGWETH